MTCPTCASPLPAGAMFCGECGRAVTSADVAAQRSADPARGARPDGAAAASGVVAPPWQQRPPQHVPAPGAEPWWVRDRAGDDAAPGPQDHRPDATAAPAPPSPRSSGAPTTAELSSWPPPVAPGRGEEPERPGRTGQREQPGQPEQDQQADVVAASRAAEREPSPRDPSPRDPAPEPPVSLREPRPVVDASPRPSSAPLWTASLAPLPSVPAVPEQDAVGAPERAEADVPSTREHAAAESRAAGAGADVPERQGRHAGPVPASSPVEPADGPDRRDGPVPPARGEGADRAERSRRASPADEPARGQDAPGAAPTAGDTARVERLLPDVAPAESAPGGAAAEDPASAGPVASRDPASSSSSSSSSSTSSTSDEGDGAVRDAAPDDRRGDSGPGTEVPAVSAAGPVPLVEPGAQAERCTQCGALVHEDDIFCGECGAVVQSVARSFTGPVVPLAPAWQPPVTEEQPASGGPAGGETAAEGADPDPDRSADADAERRRRVDLAARRALEWPPPTASSGDDVEDAARRRDERSGEPGRGGVDPVSAPALPPDVRPAPLVEPPVTGVPGAVRGALPDGPGRPVSPERPLASSVPPLLPPVPPSVSTASWASPAPSGADDDVDETRIVRRRPAGDEFTLQFSTGESVLVSGHGLLGRAPVAQPGESFEHLVRITDPGKSVSKTHLEFGQEAGHLWVSDRWSGNGTLVRPTDGPARRVQPGTRVRVERGTRVDIGEQFFLVS